jgi:hypothetical protein
VCLANDATVRSHVVVPSPVSGLAPLRDIHPRAPARCSHQAARSPRSTHGSR